jgi:hypothetical protein
MTGAGPFSADQRTSVTRRVEDCRPRDCTTDQEKPYAGAF